MSVVVIVGVVLIDGSKGSTREWVGEIFLTRRSAECCRVTVGMVGSCVRRRRIGMCDVVDSVKGVSEVSTRNFLSTVDRMREIRNRQVENRNIPTNG